MPVTLSMRNILKQLGLSEDEIETLLPNGGFGANGFPGGYWPNESDGLTWAEREKRKDDEGYQ